MGGRRPAASATVAQRDKSRVHLVKDFAQCATYAESSKAHIRYPACRAGEFRFGTRHPPHRKGNQMDKLKIESKLAQSEQKPAGTQSPARTLENLACQQELLRHVSGGHGIIVRPSFTFRP